MSVAILTLPTATPIPVTERERMIATINAAERLVSDIRALLTRIENLDPRDRLQVRRDEGQMRRNLQVFDQFLGAISELMP